MNNSNVNENISLAQFDLRVLPNQEPDYEEKKVLENVLEIFLEIQF